MREVIVFRDSGCSGFPEYRVDSQFMHFMDENKVMTKNLQSVSLRRAVSVLLRSESPNFALTILKVDRCSNVCGSAPNTLHA